MSTKNDKDIAKSIGLMQVNTADAIEDVAFDILFTMHKASPKNFKEEMEEFRERVTRAYPSLSPEQVAAKLKGFEEFTEEKMNKKIEKVFRDWTGGEFYDTHDKVKSTLLLGPPGQGKTTTFKEAAKKVSSALGLSFKLNPGDEEIIMPNDFMFVSMEFSGENQITTLGGIPAKTFDESTGVEYMTKLCNKRLALATKAGGSLVLLDDFPNAAPSVQNVGLSLTDEKRFQGLNLDNVYIGLTGNLGSLDGTHTTRLSTALRGRCKIYYTEDELPKWIERVQQKYRDPIGDAGIVGFLHREQAMFMSMPDTKQSGGFPSPRTWDHFLQEVRREIVKAGGPGREGRAMGKIQQLAGSLLGLEVGNKVYAYYYSLMQGADPLARELICEGRFNEDRFKEKMGNGYSSQSQDFTYQFSIALGDWAVKELVGANNEFFDDRNPRFKEIMERLAKGLVQAGEANLTFAVDHFKSKLANQMDAWVVVGGNKQRNLNIDMKKAMSVIVGNAKGMDKGMQALLIGALSDHDKYAERKASRPK